MKFPERKQELLNTGRYQEINNLKKQFYIDTGIGLDQCIRESDKPDFMMYEILNTPGFLAKDVKPLELRCVNQLQDARRQKAYRIKEQIKYYSIRSYPMIFATFTFNQEALNLDSKYRKEYITRILNKNPGIVDYVGNIDYGDINEREHYHYILVMNPEFIPEIKKRTIKSKTTRKYQSVENTGINYEKGFTTYELIGTDVDDYNKISKYISKLTMHAIKESTGNHMITRKKSPYHDYKKLINKHINEYKEAIQDRKEKSRIRKIQEIERDTGMSYEDYIRIGGISLYDK